MNRHRRKIIWIMVLGALGVLPIAYFVGGAVRRHRCKKTLVRIISDADRAVVYDTTKPDITREYAGNDLHIIVKAISESQSDDELYDTPVGLFSVEFYEGRRLLAEIGACSNLWRYRGRQYRAPHDSRFSEYLKIRESP